MHSSRNNNVGSQAAAAAQPYPSQTANADRSARPLNTGTEPVMRPNAQDPAAMQAHPGARASAYQQGMTHLPPQGGPGGAVGDPYANTVANNDVAPVNHFSTGQRTGSASATAGKIERVVGTMLCNPTLKAKGIEKEREAQALKVQRAEISEAERLEHEAQLRRERAVQHGAHPSNRALGGSAQAQEFGGNFGNASATGTGPGVGNSSIPMARGGAM